MTTTETLLIPRKEVHSLLSIKECINAIEEIFALRALGKVPQPAILGVHASDGGFHTKAGIARLKSNYFVSKTNANFPNNKVIGLPTIQGIVMVSDADNGRLLALMDSMELTIIRTGAATALAAKYLSRENSPVVLICGCGNQGRISIKCLTEVRKLKKVFVYDIDPHIALKLASDLSKELTIDVSVVQRIADVSKQCDIIVTCTPSKKYYLQRDHIAPGAFIAAVGSDNEQKQEIEPALLQANKVVTDSTEQCATIGELHHAIEAGLVTKASVYAELGEIIASKKKGRESDDEIIVFDSTGTALQDVATATIVYEKALQSNVKKLNFGE
jgi:ornithine cyclodeaminase/alanine dehydrogenase-like protein (mu-crystallin family)